MKCSFCPNEAVARLNGKYLLCPDCVERVSVSLLEKNKPVGMAVQGDLKVILVPQRRGTA